MYFIDDQSKGHYLLLNDVLWCTIDKEFRPGFSFNKSYYIFCMYEKTCEQYQYNIGMLVEQYNLRFFLITDSGSILLLENAYHELTKEYYAANMIGQFQ